MGGFFRGWRRKCGCVTLVLACAVMVGWVRSAVYYDGVDITPSSRRHVIRSMTGRISWFYAHSYETRVINRGIRFPSFKINPEDEHEIDLGEGSKGLIVRDFRFLRNSQLWDHYTELVQTPGAPVSVDMKLVQVPHWALVLPLTAVSAYLLLSKPRQKPSAPPQDAQP